MLIKNLQKKYGDKTVYENFDLDIQDGGVTVILGESGSGKTTLLNVLAGLTEFSGEIIGKPERASMVFARDCLIPNLTVRDNLKLFCPDIDVEDALSSVGLRDCADDYPASLSAGMARRIAILRALSFDAPLLLLDEPFVNLDLSLKYKLADTVKALNAKTKNTVVMVTHDIKEAVYMADRLIVIRGGKIIYDEKNADASTTENKLFDILRYGR